MDAVPGNTAKNYTFVWSKSINNYDRKLDEKIKNRLREIDRIAAEENQIYLDDDLEERLGRLPENIVADAGYGSEENYEYLEGKNLGSYVKYNKFHWEKKKKNRTVQVSHRLNELKRKANENRILET